MASKAARLIYRHRQNFKDDDEDARLGRSAALSQRLARSAGTKRRRTKPLPRTHRTLAVLLESMRDYYMVFELKNETEVSGVLYDVDANLNVNLVDAQLRDRHGRSQRLETMYINGSTVRYVRLPDKVRKTRISRGAALRFILSLARRSTPCELLTNISTPGLEYAVPKADRSARSPCRASFPLRRRLNFQLHIQVGCSTSRSVQQRLTITPPEAEASTLT